jgi:hypothetical protein
MSMLLSHSEADRRMVEEALPGFMFALLFNSLRNMGYTVRSDLEELANKCSAVAIAVAPIAKQPTLAKIVQDHGYAVLKECGTDTVNELIGGLARCLVKLQDQGRHVNQDGLIIALGICAEIDDGVEDWGKPAKLNVVMSRIDNELRKKGYYWQEVSL